MKVTPTLITAYKLLAVMQSSGSTQSMTIERVTRTGYSKETSPDSTFRLKQDAVMVENGVLANLTTRALRIVIKLMDDLYWQNALWYYEALDSRDRTALKELREKEILIKTEDPHIFLVNPMLIRKGSPGGVMAATLKVLETVSRVNKSIIKDLHIKGNFLFNPYYQLLVE